MGMTGRGARRLGGEGAVINPFMDNGIIQRISITVDNKFNRGKIPAFSLWAPSDKTSNPWKYMPYIPPIPCTDCASTTVLDIENRWHDYFRVGDEILYLNMVEIGTASNDLQFGGNSANDETDDVLGTNTITITAISDKDGGTNGAGYTKITSVDTWAVGLHEGGLGTGDIIVLAGSSANATSMIQAYQTADEVVIMEQEFNFQDAITGNLGEGGYLVESAVYSYTGRIDKDYINYHPVLNTFDSSPAIAAGAANCKQYTSDRLMFSTIYRG